MRQLFLRFRPRMGKIRLVCISCSLMHELSMSGNRVAWGWALLTLLVCSGNSVDTHVHKATKLRECKAKPTATHAVVGPIARRRLLLFTSCFFTDHQRSTMWGLMRRAYRGFHLERIWPFSFTCLSLQHWEELESLQEVESLKLVLHVSDGPLAVHLAAYRSLLLCKWFTVRSCHLLHGHSWLDQYPRACGTHCNWWSPGLHWRHILFEQESCVPHIRD